jgi:P27 family predicted phage terminase small subunit
VREKVPRAPRSLEAAGRAVWREAWRLPRIVAADRLAVEGLAHAADEAARLRAVIAERGELVARTIQTSRGEVVATEYVPNPGLAHLRALGREIAAISATLGLTPASRRELGLYVPADAREPDALDELKAKRERRMRAAFGGGS